MQCVISHFSGIYTRCSCHRSTQGTKTKEQMQQLQQHKARASFKMSNWTIEMRKKLILHDYMQIYCWFWICERIYDVFIWVKNVVFSFFFLYAMQVYFAATAVLFICHCLFFCLLDIRSHTGSAMLRALYREWNM